VTQRLLDALESEADPASARIAAIALGEIGNASPRALGPRALERLQALRDGAGDAELRRAAARSLERLATGGAR
jgi:hypothetical protein